MFFFLTYSTKGIRFDNWLSMQCFYFANFIVEIWLSPLMKGNVIIV